MEAIEIIKKIAEEEVKKLHVLDLGIVTSIFSHSDEGDKDNYECNVKLKNHDLELRRVPIATQHIGLTYVPNIGDLVLLAYVKGNINAPVVIGRLYNDESRPPLNNANEIIFESPDSEKSDVRRLCLKFSNGITLTVKDDELKAEIGKSVVTIKTDGDITIESNAKVEITAKGDMALLAQNIKIESKQALEMRAGTTGKLEASSTLDVKGAMVNIN
jgi:phage baseplate assembly protein gpV